MKEALYYTKLDDNKVRCELCFHNCILKAGKTGLCNARKNIQGTLQAINYAEVVSLATDPIEKKPLYHFHPSKMILSTAPNSCNLKCEFCQNWEISQTKILTRTVSPSQLIKMALENNSFGIAYTYSEPLTWYEYLKDAGEIAHKHNLKNVLVTHGTINEIPLREILPLIDAMNIDIKFMQAKLYKKICKGDLESSLRTAEIAKKAGVHIEITNLVIPTLNDDEEQTSKLIDWIADVLGVDTPLHFSRYFPRYKLNIPLTPNETLEKLWKKAKKRLHYVYVGNTHIDGSSETFCYNCDNLLISRSGYITKIVGIKDDKCSKCGIKVDVVLG